MTRPDKTEYAPYQEKYISLIQDDVFKTLNDQMISFSSYIESKTDEQLNYRYAPDKWTVKDVIMHIVDTETIFMYRALSFARGETAELPGFDQDVFADTLDTTSFSKEYLVELFQSVRKTTLLFLKQIQDDMWDKRGSMSGYQMTLRAMPFMVAGHLQHHLNILEERYL